MSWFKGGTWLDHPCKVPSPNSSAVGDRWKCKCGRIWEVFEYGKLWSDYRWKEVKNSE